MQMIDPFSDQVFRPVRRQRKQEQAASSPVDITLSPELESSLLERTGSVAMSGISSAGNLLDLPGSMVRDVVAWKNPLDQLLTPFSAENRTTGRDLNRKIGLSGRRDSWGNFFGGLGTEIALDPLTYLTLGGSALTKSGQLAKKTGLLDDVGRVAAKRAGKRLNEVGPRQARMSTSFQDLLSEASSAKQTEVMDLLSKQGVNIADIADQKVGGLVGVGLPFKDPSFTLGSGQRSQKAAGMLDKYSLNPAAVGSSVRHASVPGTNFKPVDNFYRLFDSKLKDTKTPLGQELAKGLFHGQEAGESRARGAIVDYVNRIQKSGMADPDQADELRRIFEDPAYRAAASPEMRGLADDIRVNLDRVLTESESLGLPVSQLMDDTIDYFPRFMTDSVRQSGRGVREAFSTFDTSSLQRQEILRGIEGGTASIKEIIQHPNIKSAIDGGHPKEAIASEIESLFPGRVPAETIESFSDYIKGLPEEAREVGLFGNHPMVDLTARLKSGEDSIEAAKTVYEGLAQPGVLSQSYDGVKLGKLLGDLGFGVEESRKVLSSKTGVSVKALKGMVVEPGLAEDLGRFMKGFSSPEPVNEIMQAVDSVTNFTKGMLTGVWPSFHVRNLTSGQFQNWVGGVFSGESIKQAHSMMRGDVVSFAKDIPSVQKLAADRGIHASSLTDDVATEILGEISYAHQVLGKFSGEHATVSGQASGVGAAGLDGIVDEIMGPGRQHVNAQRTLSRAVGHSPETTINPAKAQFRGVAGATESTFGPAKAGEDVGHYVEGLNRLAPFIKQLKEGVSPEVAARKVGAIQANYENKYFTAFERKGMQRLFPFYKFSKSMIPWHLRELTESPGGKLAQTIRTVNNARDPQELTPDYVAETASIPINGGPLEALLGAPKEPGANRYLTGLGLMMEDPLSFAGLLNGDIRGTGLEVLSRTNPLVKGPLEWFTGESFFQKGPMGGRDLEDMDPTIGRTLANITGRKRPVKLPPMLEHTVMNTPLSRFLTTARQFSDPRKSIGTKAANFLTGLRISDISPAAQDAVLQERADQLMKSLGAKDYNKTYFPKDMLENMSGTELEQALALKALQNLMNRRAKERKAAKSK